MATQTDSQSNQIPEHLLPGYDPGVFLTRKEHDKYDKTLKYITKKNFIILEKYKLRLENGLVQNPNWFVGNSMLYTAAQAQYNYFKSKPVSNKENLCKIFSDLKRYCTNIIRMVAGFDIELFKT